MSAPARGKSTLMDDMDGDCETLATRLSRSRKQNQSKSQAQKSTSTQNLDQHLVLYVHSQNDQSAEARKQEIVLCLKEQPLKSPPYLPEASNTVVKALPHCSENVSELVKVDKPFIGPVVEIDDSEDSEDNKPLCSWLPIALPKVNSNLAIKEFKASRLGRQPSIPENQNGSSVKDSDPKKLSTLISKKHASEVVSDDDDVPLSQMIKKLPAPDKKSLGIVEVTSAAFLSVVQRTKSPSVVQRIKSSQCPKSSRVCRGSVKRLKGTRLIHNGMAFPHPNYEEMVKKRKMNTEGIETVNGTNSQNEASKADEMNGFSESVCEICDDGGSLVCCQGKCMRSFHPTIKDGADYHCMSLGYTDAEVEELNSKDFYCENCKYKQHQCFVCGELGSSDKSYGAEVFRCSDGSCGRFYHPLCVAKLLHHGDKIEGEKEQKEIAAGKVFICPLHKCHVCGKLEVKTEKNLQFAVCRRCPKAYHRKCLPKGIAYTEDEDKAILQRAWNGLLPNRVLIYCLDHEMDESLSTPIRNHIRFPVIDVSKKEQPFSSFSEKTAALKEIGASREKFAAKESDTKRSKGVEDLSFGELDKKLSGNLREGKDGRTCGPCVDQVDNRDVDIRSKARLDELNEMRPNSMSSGHSLAQKNSSATRPGFRANLFGFSFAQERRPTPGSSAGWLEE